MNHITWIVWVGRIHCCHSVFSHHLLYFPSVNRFTQEFHRGACITPAKCIKLSTFNFVLLYYWLSNASLNLYLSKTKSKGTCNKLPTLPHIPHLCSDVFTPPLPSGEEPQTRAVSGKWSSIFICALCWPSFGTVHSIQPQVCFCLASAYTSQFYVLS